MSLSTLILSDLGRIPLSDPMLGPRTRALHGCARQHSL